MSEVGFTRAGNAWRWRGRRPSRGDGRGSGSHAFAELAKLKHEWLVLGSCLVIEFDREAHFGPAAGANWLGHDDTMTRVVCHAKDIGDFDRQWGKPPIDFRRGRRLFSRRRS